MCVIITHIIPDAKVTDLQPSLPAAAGETLAGHPASVASAEPVVDGLAASVVAAVVVAAAAHTAA